MPGLGGAVEGEDEGDGLAGFGSVHSKGCAVAEDGDQILNLAEMTLMAHGPGGAGARAHGIIGLGRADGGILGLRGTKIPAFDAVVLENDGAIFPAEFDAAGPAGIGGGGGLDGAEGAAGKTQRGDGGVFDLDTEVDAAGVAGKNVGR